MTPQARSARLKAGEFGSSPLLLFKLIPTPPRLKSGSGKLAKPWLRMHRENLSAAAR